MPRAETQGSTERYIGSWLKKSGRRDQVVLATKAAGPNKSMTWVRGGKQNFDAANLRAAVDTSLQRLQTDHIDLYQLHWPSRNLPIFWNLFTWYYGIPSSSSHALIGGLVGAAVAKSGTGALVAAGLWKTVAFIVIAPVLGFVFGSISSIQMMPMVFCASLPPWPRL